MACWLENVEIKNLVHESARYSNELFLTTQLPRFLIKIITFVVFAGSVSRLEGMKEQNLHVTFSIHEMLKGKSLKWTWKVFLKGFSCEILN